MVAPPTLYQKILNFKPEIGFLRGMCTKLRTTTKFVCRDPDFLKSVFDCRKNETFNPFYVRGFLDRLPHAFWFEFDVNGKRIGLFRHGDWFYNIEELKDINVCDVLPFRYFVKDGEESVEYLFSDDIDKETRESSAKYTASLCFVFLRHFAQILQHDPEVVTRDVVKPMMKRDGRGRKLYPHVLIKQGVIDLARQKYEASQRSTSGSETGLKRAIHDLRGHYRRYRKSGKTVFVRAHQRGDAGAGIIERPHYEIRV